MVNPELLARYDRPGPRYTSYPTAVEFTEEFGADRYATYLARAAGHVDEPLSLYLHLPFCESRCSFCGCHVVIARRQSVAEVYLERLVSEASLLREHLGDRRRLAQYHWGGGTPTYYTPEQLAGLHRDLLVHFDLEPAAEVGVEVDPRITTTEHLEVLRELGFNRLSMGVQDIDPTVQELIGRHQTAEQTVSTFDTARRLGFESVNVDLIYGLPGQDRVSFQRTLDQVVALRPDRLAVYSFAFVPWVRPQQRRIDTGLLPDRDTKFALLSAAVETLLEAGYTQIGMDHFALPDDELARARTEGILSRNFMGYTVKRVGDMVALGTSGIADVQGAYAQNHKRLASYYEEIEAGRLPIERGVVLSDDDLVRRFVITELMCNDRVGAAEVRDRFGIDFAQYFDQELSDLTAPGGLVEEGMAVVDAEGVRAVGVGSAFIRNLAMTFDAYLRRAADPGTPVFSTTV